MSGTNPDNGKNPSGDPSAGLPVGNAEGGLNGPVGRHARAVSIKGDTSKFGFSSSFTKEIADFVDDADEDIISDLVVDLVNTDLPYCKEIRTKSVGLLNKAVELFKEASAVFFEGKTLIASDERLLLALQEYVEKLQNDLKYYSEEWFSKKVEEGILSEGKGPDFFNKPNFAEALEKNLLPNTKGLSWAEMVEEDLGSLVTSELGKSTSLVSVIRNKAGLKTENRVLIPGNLKKTLPVLYGRFKTACELSKSELIEDPQTLITLSRPVVWGADINARDQFLGTLYDDKGLPKTELLEIADLGTLSDNMLELPSVESIESRGPGRTGLWHSVNLISRIYCEQVYDTPISKQKNWWKVGGQIRDKMRSEISNQVGGEAPALLILNAFDILYRKFIRIVLKSKNAEHVQRLQSLITDYSAILFCKGGTLFNNLLRTETKVRKVESEMPLKKGGKTQKVLVDEKYTVHLRPKIADGPRTAFESSVYAKVNGALAKIDSKAHNYVLGSKTYSSPNEWEKSHKDWVENLYQKTKIPSHLMVQRKQTIRANVMAQIAKAESSSGKSATDNKEKSVITQASWISSQNSYLQENEEKLDLESIRALNSMLGTSYKKDGLINLSEDEITIVFSQY
jgi:hypothetical protein